MTWFTKKGYEVNEALTHLVIPVVNSTCGAQTPVGNETLNFERIRDIISSTDISAS